MAAFTWDATAGHYLDASGKPVPEATIRTMVQDLTAATQDRLGTLAQERATGKLDTLGWRIAVQDALKSSNVAAAALAHGGLPQMDAREKGWVGARLKEQYGYLSGLALDVADGSLDVTSAAFQARAEMYAGSVHSVYEAARRRAAGKRGDDQERNLQAADAAHCDDCQAETDRGWVDMGELSEPGSRQCLTRCRCVLVTRKADVAEESAA